MLKDANNLRLTQVSSSWFARPPATHPGATSKLRWLASLSQCSRPAQVKATISCLNPAFSNETKQRSIETMCESMWLVGRWLENNGNTIFVDSRTLQQCLLTDALSTVRSDDLRITLPYLHFVLPSEEGIIIKGDEYTECLVCFSEDNALDILWFSPDFGCSPIPVVIYLNGSGLLLDQFRKTQHENSVAFGQKAKNGLMQLLSKEEYEQLAGLIASFLLIMQSYPNYLSKIEVSDRNFTFAGKPKPQSFTMSTGIRNLRADVVEGSSGTGVEHASPSSHWRRGHWRRQRHGPAYEEENPRSEIIIMPDGGRAHMKWILPVFVGHEAPQQETSA